MDFKIVGQMALAMYATTLIHHITYIKVSYRRYSELLIILNKRHAATSMINCFLNCFAGPIQVNEFRADIGRKLDLDLN